MNSLYLLPFLGRQPFPALCLFMSVCLCLYVSLHLSASVHALRLSSSLQISLLSAHVSHFDISYQILAPASFSQFLGLLDFDFCPSVGAVCRVCICCVS